MIGTTISHYKILQKIGEGGMGEVFLAHDASLDRKVAIKFLPEPLRQDDLARRRFLREARSAAALDHPYICSIHEVGEAEGKSFIVMECVEGQTLKDRLAQGPVALKEAMEWAVEIAEALAAGAYLAVHGVLSYQKAKWAREKLLPQIENWPRIYSGQVKARTPGRPLSSPPRRD